MSTAVSTLHLRPIEDGSWSLIRDEATNPATVYPTEGQAIASVYDLVAAPGEAEVLIHEADGRLRATVIIRRGPSVGSWDHLDLDDPEARAEALRITPSNGRLKAGIGKYPPPVGDFDNEEMAC
jgi:Uncharacterized protein conserved in bacteria (DUF2188)